MKSKIKKEFFFVGLWIIISLILSYFIFYISDNYFYFLIPIITIPLTLYFKNIFNDNYNNEIISSLTLIIFFFWLTVNFYSKYFFFLLLCFVIFFIILLSKKRFPKLETSVIIILTVMTLVLNFPIIAPDVEVIEHFDINYGEYYNGEPYVHHGYRFKITSPLVPAICADFYTDHNIRNDFKLNYNPNYNITIKDGRWHICPNFIANGITIQEVSFLSYGNLMFSHNTEIDNLGYLDENIYMDYLNYINSENFDIRVDSNFTYTINNTLKFKNTTFYDYVKNPPYLLDCKLNSFFISNDMVRGNDEPVDHYSVTNDTISLTFDEFIYLEAKNTTKKYLLFDDTYWEKCVN